MQPRREVLLALAALAFVPALACSQRTPRAETGQLRAGNHEFTLRHEGRRRTYLVHVPPGAGAALPVLVAFHGGGGNAGGFQLYAELDRLADRERFLVVYPNGTGRLVTRLLTWNAGDGCCGYALNNGVDDVGYAVAVVEDLGRRTSIDRRRVYATGHSNGGIMSHRLAAERAGFVAAIAPVAGSLDLRSFAPVRAVPVMQIHSVDDPRALYEGGLGPPFPGTDNRVMHQPVQAGLDRWIVANGCATRPDTLDRRAESHGGATHRAMLLAWRGCRGGAEVRHWKLTGPGHAWPGDARPPGGEAISGPQTTVVRAADEVWAFVSRFRLP
ncbi:MAG: prolyl oligopeptidase family serine peptidase [Gemmatimonadaceae bacterium]|nr:prolyl oligopeptidase family serine peptidase [Gemmatimonadaceae bacterium]